MFRRIKGITDFIAETLKDAKFGREEFDPRFYPAGKVRVKDAPEYRPNVIDTGTMIPQERITLSDLEGRPYLTTMSDRTAAGGLLEGIGNQPIAHPIRLTGGQDYMRDDTGELWASGAGVVPNMVKAASEIKDQYGSSPVFMPWRMSPSGGDFAHMTGQTMLSWASANMPKGVKKQLDSEMKLFVPDWAGVDDPKSLAQYGALPDKQRKQAMNMMDKNFRNQGGISQTQARLAVSDQSQLLSPVSGFQNVGEIDLKRGVLEGGGNPTYPSGLAGEYTGTLDTDVTAIDLNPQRYARARNKDGSFDSGPQGPDYLSTKDAPRRAMEVGYYGGVIDEPLLRKLSDEGFKVDSGLLPGIATAGVAGASLLGSEEADAGPIGLLRNVFPAPQRMFDPNDKAYKPFLESFEQTPGGRYLEMGPDGPKDITGEYPESAQLGVGPDGKPKFQVAPTQATNIPDAKGPGRKIKTNLAKKKTGWKWTQAPEGYDPDPDGGFPIVSVNDGKDHYYTLNTDFPEGVELARYPNEASEPRLKPTRKGHVNLGEKVGEIEMRGKKHPVYDSITIRQAAPVAMAGLLGAGMSEESDASIVGMFSKLGASRADLKGMATKMEAEGLSPKEIVEKTGWYKGAQDGKWRTELPNTNTKINLPDVDFAKTDETKVVMRLDEVVDDPALLSQYDVDVQEAGSGFNLGEADFAEAGNGRTVGALGKTRVVFDSELPPGEGYFDGMMITVSALSSPQEQRATILHELQHVIQRREQFAEGANETLFERDKYFSDLWTDSLDKKLEGLDKAYLEKNEYGMSSLSREDREMRDKLRLAKMKADRFRKESAKAGTDNPFNMYLASAGEVEARNVELRDKTMSPSGLRAVPPSETESVPSSSQIFRPEDDPVTSFENVVDDRYNSYRKPNVRATEKSRFESLMRENERLREMGSASWGKVSPELAAYRRSQMLPSIAEMGMGALGGAVDSIDWLSQIPSSIFNPSMSDRTPLRDSLGGLLDYNFMDERDRKAIEEARLIGGLLSPY